MAEASAQDTKSKVTLEVIFEPHSPRTTRLGPWLTCAQARLPSAARQDRMARTGEPLLLYSTVYVSRAAAPLWPLVTSRPPAPLTWQCCDDHRKPFALGVFEYRPNACLVRNHLLPVTKPMEPESSRNRSTIVASE